MRVMFVLCLLAIFFGACASSRVPAARMASAPQSDPLAERAYAVIRDNCWGCHGEPGKQAYGEVAPVDWILDYDKLIQNSMVIPGLPAKSRLIYITAVEGKMPRKFDAEGMPRLDGELSEADQQTLIDWVKQGAPRWR